MTECHRITVTQCHLHFTALSPTLTFILLALSLTLSTLPTLHPHAFASLASHTTSVQQRTHNQSHTHTHSHSQFNLPQWILGRSRPTSHTSHPPLILPPPFPPGHRALHCPVVYCIVLYCCSPVWPSKMDTAFTTSVDKIVAELEKLSSSVEKMSIAEAPKDFKPAAVHAAMKSFKCLVGELVGVVGLVTRLVEPVVACGGSCGTPAVEIDQVQQDAKSGCLVISNNRSVTDRSKLPIRPAEVRRKEPGPSNAQIVCEAIRANLGVTVDPNEIEHSRQLSDFSISVKLRMSGQDSAWHRTCQAMYRKPVRTGESAPSTYVTFDVTKARNHILWCVSTIEEGFQVSNRRVLYRSQRSDLGEGQGGWTEDQVDVFFTW